MPTISSPNYGYSYTPSTVRTPCLFASQVSGASVNDIVGVTYALDDTTGAHDVPIPPSISFGTTIAPTQGERTLTLGVVTQSGPLTITTSALFNFTVVGPEMPLVALALNAAASALDMEFRADNSAVLVPSALRSKGHSVAVAKKSEKAKAGGLVERAVTFTFTHETASKNLHALVFPPYRREVGTMPPQPLLVEKVKGAVDLTFTHRNENNRYHVQVIAWDQEELEALATDVWNHNSKLQVGDPAWRQVRLAAVMIAPKPTLVHDKIVP